MGLMKSPTPAEIAVLTLVMVGLLIGFGLTGLAVAWQAPPEKHDLAHALNFLSSCSLGLGILLALTYRIVRRWLG